LYENLLKEARQRPFSNGSPQADFETSDRLAVKAGVRNANQFTLIFLCEFKLRQLVRVTSMYRKPMSPTSRMLFALLFAFFPA
jgi:hypothetical protein